MAKEKPPVGAGDLIKTYVLFIITHVVHEMQKDLLQQVKSQGIS